MRNPCTNIASMATATDIPDWCYIETLGTGLYNFSDFQSPSREELGVMWDKSPIAHMKHVKAPTLMALGMKDLRVPPSQGIEYYHALRAKNIPTKLLVYEDCDHAIDRVASEADHWLNIKQWFDEHL
jgi:acylaminoacyl-peptidase